MPLLVIRHQDVLWPHCLQHKKGQGWVGPQGLWARDRPSRIPQEPVPCNTVLLFLKLSIMARLEHTHKKKNHHKEMLSYRSLNATDIAFICISSQALSWKPRTERLGMAGQCWDTRSQICLQRVEKVSRQAEVPSERSISASSLLFFAFFRVNM